MPDRSQYFLRDFLIGNADLPRLTFPTIRSRVRRADPNPGAGKNYPYYPGLAGNLQVVLRPAPGQAPTATVNVAFASDDYSAAIAAINTAGGANLEAFDDGGYLVLRSKLGGGQNLMEVTGSAAATTLGFDDKSLGGVSHAGDLASAPSGGVQANPHGSVLLSRDEALTSKNVNRAIVGALTRMDQVLGELSQEVAVYEELALPLGADDDKFTIDFGTRLAIGAISGFGVAQAIRLRTSAGAVVYDKATGKDEVTVASVTYGPSVDPNQIFADWTTPDGKSVLCAPDTIKLQGVAITEVRGNYLKAAGAQFQTKKVDPRDILVISTATNIEPFSHNGQFVVETVLSEDSVLVRPAGPREYILPNTATPPGLNPVKTGGQSYGEIKVCIGKFLRCGMMESGGGVNDHMIFNLSHEIVAGVYLLSLPIGKTVRDVRSLLSNTYFADPNLAHVKKAYTWTDKQTHEDQQIFGVFADPDDARRETDLTNANPYIHLESTNPPNLGFDIYLDSNDGSYLIVNNAFWDSPNAKWGKHSINVPATLVRFKPDKIQVWARASADNVSWDDQIGPWDNPNFRYENWSPVLEIPVDAQAWKGPIKSAPLLLGAFGTEGEFQAYHPRWDVRTVEAGNPLWTCLGRIRKASAGEFDTTNIREWAHVTGIRAFSINCYWYNGVWNKDDGPIEGTLIQFEHTKVRVRRRLEADNNTWSDVQWTETLDLDVVRNRWENLSYADPATFDASAGSHFFMALAGNVTAWSITNGQIGQIVTIELFQGAGGGHTISGHAASIKIAGGAWALTAAAGAVDSLTLRYDGSEWHEIGRAFDLQ